MVSLAARGTIDLVTLGEDESEVFVSLARDIDDGEAATIAVASHRGLAVATDDRRARHVATALNPPVRLIHTTEVVKRWADQPGVDAQQAADAVQSIKVRASYVPARDDPHLSWWRMLSQP